MIRSWSADISVGIYYLLLVTFPVVFQETYSFSVGETGLVRGVQQRPSVLKNDVCAGIPRSEYWNISFRGFSGIAAPYLWPCA